VVPDDVDAVDPDEVPDDVPADELLVPDDPERRVDVEPLERRVVVREGDADDVPVAGGAATSPGAGVCSMGETESIGTVGDTDSALSTGDLSALVQPAPASTTIVARRILFMGPRSLGIPKKAFDMPETRLLRTS
jgi:hypothetical protein